METEIRRDRFISGSTSSGGVVTITPNNTLSVSADPERKIIISDKSEKELYWEKFRSLVKK